jgi:alpha-D-ribose 1-methylphosphonate 5-triphosphate synthase subunit PhnL
MTAHTQSHFDPLGGHFDPLGGFDVHALAARFTASHRQAAERVLDVYQKTVGQVADALVRSARVTNLPAVVTIAETQAALSRDTADAYARSVRSLLEL